MTGLINAIFRLLEFVMVVLILGMVGMVFGNVVLRYGFDSSISVSEELSRYFFVWLTFIGAVVVMREGQHLGVDALPRILGQGGRFVLLVVSDLFILLCCVLFFWGTWRNAPLQADNVSPVAGLNMLLVYGVGFITSVGIGLMVAARLVRALTGRLGANELREFAGEHLDSDGPRIVRVE